MTSTTSSGIRRRTVLSIAGAGALGTLAGCISATDDDGSAERDDSDAEKAETDDDEPLTDYQYTAPPQIVDLADQGYESTLRTVPARHELVTEAGSGGPVELPEVWAWQADDLEPSVPGPIYRMTEGDTFELTYDNSEHGRPHTVHVHAVGKTWADDGAPVTNREHVGPGESHTYTLHADVPGTHVYHCHYQTHNHLDMGMYGILRVDPEGYEAPDREYFLTLRDWDTRLHDREAGGGADYSPSARSSDAYTINGRSAPTTFHPELGSPLLVSEGETMRIHLANNGYESHPFHTHGHRFTVVEKDGSVVPEAARYEEDVINIAPAERYTIELEADADPGIYPAHCHKVHHVTTEDRYPGGMATAIVYEEAMETEEFGEIMSDAGYDS
ncbi:multicopper oxidase domain-containing protein [Natronococcus sp. A-GB7]|uniref:multicopper oxidase domain-containing protein n=1 Tax=Natronococcus sp. A-GB7 TaxID=3037649 RepID=UPI00241DDDB6|nr:multicopper oxidase domain-containing protein [Natronococcus sp. A-GB7]MDG5819697.1 multicopper oxidase domain-containing protein [Natronococcus sp. A-GB7]